jgi:outer membrane lipoprotein-sorting protein
VESETGSKEGGNSPSLTLVPKPAENEAPTIKKIVLKLFPDSFLIHEITVFEVSGNISRVVFEHIQLNKGLSTRLLTFKVPPGVVVVELP